MKTQLLSNLFRGLLLMSLVPSLAHARAFVELVDGQRVPVDRILSRPDGTLAVFRDGQSTDIARDQYIRAVGVQPERMEEATRLVDQGEGAQAVSILNEIFRASSYQTWDVSAGLLLIRVHLADNNVVSARQTLDQLKRRYGDRTFSLFPDLQAKDWSIRIAGGQISGLEDELTDVIRDSDNRALVGRALIARGDLKLARTQLRPAVLDYLRAAHFYRGQEDVHAQALLKAGQVFTQLGETANARRFLTELRTRYPDSTYAARAPQ
ncbi:MAG: tetratricopeptide repeat protein [Verrucomicrobia bacterium]|nr:tetratricopeptide repeat protein [Verrucomicrobiota bacterium]MCH8528236.1 tetratricopeptide repeat protein [Kiritimatiellia bacterium]